MSVRVSQTIPDDRRRADSLITVRCRNAQRREPALLIGLRRLHRAPFASPSLAAGPSSSTWWPLRFTTRALHIFLRRIGHPLGRSTDEAELDFFLTSCVGCEGGVRVINIMSRSCWAAGTHMSSLHTLGAGLQKHPGALAPRPGSMAFRRGEAQLRNVPSTMRLGRTTYWA